MQFQSDMAETLVMVAQRQELSGIGAAYLAGIAMGVFSKETAFSNVTYREYRPSMEKCRREKLYGGWLEALARVIGEKAGGKHA